MPSSVPILSHAFSYKTICSDDFHYRRASIWRMKAHLRVSKFQKRGMPNERCICFLTLTLNVNLIRQTLVDTTISAEILDEQRFLLRHVVLKPNMYNPNCHINPSLVCVINVLCSEHFPKPFFDEASLESAQIYTTHRRLSPNLGSLTGLWT